MKINTNTHTHTHTHTNTHKRTIVVWREHIIHGADDAHGHAIVLRPQHGGRDVEAEMAERARHRVLPAQQLPVEPHVGPVVDALEQQGGANAACVGER